MLAVLVAIANIVRADVWPEKPADESTPVGVHLGIGSPSSMNVGWASYAKPQGQVCVSYGTAASALNETACSNHSITYGTSRVWYNHVELTGLEPAQLYYYKIQSSNSTTNNFTTTRAPGDTTPYSFAALADLGYHSVEGTPRLDTHDTARRWFSMRNEYSFTLFPGDYAYADTFFDDWEDLEAYFEGQDAYESLLERFHDLISPLTSSQPFMLTAGNHEATCIDIKNLNKFCPPGQTNFTDIRNRYANMLPPAFASTSNSTDAQANRTRAAELAVPPFWYSFDVGMVHYVLVNTETDFPGAPDVVGAPRGLDGGPFGFSGQQLEWLHADLSSVDRSVTPWVVVGGHRPWYTNDAKENRCETCMKAFENVFYHYGVDLVIMGHVHNSQRFRPIYNDTVDANAYNNPTAPMYIIVGGTGNSEGLTPANVQDGTPGLEWADGDNFAFAIVNVQTPSDLSVRFISSAKGQELDSAKLHKEHSQRFVRQ